MGWFGWGWLKDDIESLKAVRDLTKDEAQKAELDRIIKNLENKMKEAE